MLRTAVLHALCVTAFSQTPQNQLTESLKNGRWWEGVSSTGKLFYVAGLADGLNAGDLNAKIIAEFNGKKPAKPYDASSWLFSTATFAETVKGLDQFYEDPANAAIPIKSALVLFREKVEGASPEDLARKVADARRASSGK